VDKTRTVPQTLSHSPQDGRTPHWLVFLLMPLLHFASVKLTFWLAVTPENEVVVWLPNAVLLAALLHYRGQRAWLFALLAFTSEFIGNAQIFPLLTAALLCLVNLLEVFVAYGLMRRVGCSLKLERVQDFGHFVMAGPLVGALLASLVAGFVLQETLDTGGTPYLTLARLWWFGDALGLLIYTPLLLAFAEPAKPDTSPRHWSRLDVMVVLFTMALAVAIFANPWVESGLGYLTPTLLLPSVLYMAVRLDVRWTTLATALISLAAAWALTAGNLTFGGASRHLVIMWAQEFIVTLCFVGIGFSILLDQLRSHESELEAKVRERTQALENSNRQLAVLSATDGLTGVANRRYFDETFAREWGRTARTGEMLALVMLDVDYFKAYNDHYGHLSGDDCLRDIANLLTAHYRRTGDVVARYGGEEFVLLTQVTDAQAAFSAADALREALHDLALPHAASPLGVVTVSIGLAVRVPSANESADSLLQHADDMLYQAKANGRNRTHTFVG
jgi:diguanylate cyclase (GGDEF)-like protein